MVFAHLSATGSLTSNYGDAVGIIPEAYRPVGPVYVTAKNVTSVAPANNYSTTRWIINTDGTVTMGSDQTAALERSVSVCWATK